jgi:hypothetical protein
VEVVERLTTPLAQELRGRDLLVARALTHHQTTAEAVAGAQAQSEQRELPLLAAMAALVLLIQLQVRLSHMLVAAVAALLPAEREARVVLVAVETPERLVAATERQEQLTRVVVVVVLLQTRQLGSWVEPAALVLSFFLF